jgi:5-methyltetrahydropteroyltriglutamate--homocysteine methyltransferase
MPDRLRVTHTGRLERPDALTNRMAKESHGRPSDPEFARMLRDSVADVVQRQVDTGIDIVGDGEFGKLSWSSYLSMRLGGLEQLATPRVYGMTVKDRQDFADYYRDTTTSGARYFKSPTGSEYKDFAFTGPITYVGGDALREDIANLKAAMAKAGATEGFMPSTAPGSLVYENRYYKTEQEFLFALADAVRQEYRAIVDAGLVLHIDDPVITTIWDRFYNQPPQTLVAMAEARIEALNHALMGIDPGRVRLHVCWGSWHGPHSSDVPLDTLLPVLLKANVGAYVLEAGNARHEHEWQVWKTTRLPEGRVLIPGVVSHTTDTLEHPELVAWRLSLFADVVGRDNVIAGTDCGLGYRVHDQIAWAKLRALVEGAAIASKRLWP